jgi:hypothetical protein
MDKSSDGRGWLHAKALPKKIRLKRQFLALTIAIWAVLTGAVGYVAHTFEEARVARLLSNSADRELQRMMGTSQVAYDPYSVAIWVVLAAALFFYLVPKVTREIQRKAKGAEW